MCVADLAQHTLDVQYFLWEADATGRLLSEALLRAALPRAAVPAFASDLPKVGDWVVVVGRVPDPAQPTATTGIVRCPAASRAFRFLAWGSMGLGKSPLGSG